VHAYLPAEAPRVLAGAAGSVQVAADEPLVASRSSRAARREPLVASWRAPAAASC
jgi:hypothetical protein